MLSNSQRELLQTKGVVVGRVLMGLLFLVSGLGMYFMQTPAGAAGYFATLSLPVPLVLAWLVIILKVVAGGALVIGRNVGCAAGALIVFTVLTILIAHRSFEDVNLFKNLAIIGGLLYVAAFGAGRWSSSSNS
ncbi:MAG TPA: DoxX family protein [Candidatus Paceibacterota bacterium]|nr:DoxX family protein [Candidatus Paceibacterota bacterium]HMO83165.1 DoxX family protein [Candidatus Paceibacterota bacterium]